eukprot:10843572-Karenia_brevis.AAC.1
MLSLIFSCVSPKSRGSIQEMRIVTREGNRYERRESLPEKGSVTRQGNRTSGKGIDPEGD